MKNNQLPVAPKYNTGMHMACAAQMTMLAFNACWLAAGQGSTHKALQAFVFYGNQGLVLEFASSCTHWNSVKWQRTSYDVCDHVTLLQDAGNGVIAQEAF